MDKEDPIAVIGLSYRAPGIGRKGIWDYLEQARSAWSDFPTDRFEKSAYWKPGGDRSGVFRAEGAHFLPDDIYAFDAGFFNMRTEEARASDPQHRVMLECALEAAENAGKSLLDLAGKRIGVFIGSGQHEYSQRLGDDHHAANTFSATGVAPCMVSNRISYFFDIDGPSVALDAACASSVYAAHQAVSAIRNGECNAAFVGAAALSLGPGGWLALEKTGALSTQGRSYPYDEKAGGFGRGEGAGCLLIKRLDDALRDGDPIQAVIRSSACNHGGRSEGITMPNGTAHRKLLQRVHDIAGLDPSHTPVVEGHGTGTAAGDPIEAGAFAAVLGEKRTSLNPIYIGSVKSNFGHLEGASGILGMIKAILMLKNGVILPTAGFETMNPKIQGKEKLVVPVAPLSWPANEPKRVMVTNFGFGGSNSAVILEDAAPWIIKEPLAKLNGAGAMITHETNGIHRANETNGFNGTVDVKPKAPTNGYSNHELPATTTKLFVFSARSERSLSSYLASFDQYLDESEESLEFFNNLGYTLGQRRTHYPSRVSIVADSVVSLQEKLLKAKAVRVKEHVLSWVFTGQGAQYARMAYGLQRLKTFDDAIDEAEKHLDSMGASWRLKHELSKPEDESRINEAEISQPLCTAIQIALVRLLNSWGIYPSLVMGHSSGEIAAAFAAGLISFKTAIAVSYFRGKAAARLASERKSQGAMLAVGVGFKDAAILIEQNANGLYADVAAINSPQSVTISGDQIAIDHIHKAAEAQGIFARKLKVQVAYHSRHMEDVADFYLDAIKPYCELKPRQKSDVDLGGRDPVFISSVSGSKLEADRLEASYWIENLVRPVNFAAAVEAIVASRNETKSQSSLLVIAEIGPHAALKSPIKQTLEAIGKEQDRSPSFAYYSAMRRGEDDLTSVKELAGDLFTCGAAVNFAEVNQTTPQNSSVVTELPLYAWDKTVSYEVRPRATHQKLFPGESFHPLLGRRVITDGGQQRIYRQVFSLDDMPWIRDHRVAGAVVFPMTGYMSCAIEAARRTLTSPAASFLVQDFHVVLRLEIEEEETIDMVTRIWPKATGSNSFSSNAWSFEISSWKSTSGWNIHAYGRIEPEMKPMTLDTPTMQASVPFTEVTSGLIEHDVDKAYLFAGVRATNYGPTFRNTIGFFEGKGYTLLHHRLRDLGDLVRDSSPYGSPVSVDPPTLDGFLQGGGPLQVADDGRRPAQMPNYVSRFRVSNNIPTKPRQQIDVVTRLLDYDFKGGRMQISVAALVRRSDGTLEPVAEWESIAFRAIGATEDDLDPASSLPDSWVWDVVPRVDLLEADEISRRFPVQPLSAKQVSHMRDLTTAASYYIFRALKETSDDDRSNLPAHLSRFVNWGSKLISSQGVTFDDEPSTLINSIRKHDAQGEMLCAVGEQLVPILRGDIEPLEIMLTDGLLTRHYEADVANERLSNILGDVVLSLSHLEPKLRILEVGAGTAGTTLPVLEALSRHVPPGAFANYTFTDISSGFFENARVKLAKWTHRITYKKLDISLDPISQGFKAEEFDLVIAANVLHATQDMAVTMKNLRQLMRPQGKLVVLEANDYPASALPFVLLPGWWYANDEYRDSEKGPLMTVKVWDRLLSDTGFSGVDACIRGSIDSFEEAISIMSSTRIGQTEITPNITLCGPFIDDLDVNFAQTVADTISERLGYEVEIRPFAEVEPSRDSYYVFIDSPRTPYMRAITEEVFNRVQNLLTNNAGLLWVIPECEIPESKFIKGMLRTLRLETDAKNLFSFDGVHFTPRGASGIVKLIKNLCDSEPYNAQDQDFVWHEDSVKLPRMRVVSNAKEVFAAEQGVSFRKERDIWEGDRALELTIDVSGNAESIYFRRSEDLQLPLSDGEIIVKVEAAGLSSRDLDLVQGAVPWSSPGFDGAGTVIKVGSAVSDLHEGDRVLFLSLKGSAFASYKKMPAWHAARFPSRFSVTDAATMPLAYSLAVLALNHTARLQRNETVLIHSAAGAVGQACVRIAQHLGAEIFATAGTDMKRDFLHTALGIPRNRIFVSRSAQFRDKILCETGGKGVDVIINSLTGELMADTWELAAQFGRFVDIDRKGSLQNTYLPMKSFSRNVSFSSIDLRELYRHNPEKVKDIFAEVVHLLRAGVIRPVGPLSVVPISEFSSGLRKLKSGDHWGKVVASLGHDEQVVAESDMRPTPFTLKKEATYLITGGTRGIGLNLAYWMVENGARNVILLGRSGGSGPEVQQFVKKYQDTDVTIRALSCDVGSRADLEKVVESINDLPKVRGVVHSALLLSDKLFENASFEDWKIIMQPRVQGAWNLHELMPADMDFFVALGSFLGNTGNPGQAIYAGTATFYEAFAQYRNTRGQHTVSIALPVVLDVGYVADRSLSGLLQQQIGATVTMADIRTIVKGIITKSNLVSRNGLSSVFTLSLNGEAVAKGPWTYFHPVLALSRFKDDGDHGKVNGNSGENTTSTSWTAAADPLEGLTEALISKVATMAIMEREEVQPDVLVASYNLDSLVSVELRNWIRRETSVELSLSAITQASSLRALAAEILDQRENKTREKLDN